MTEGGGTRLSIAFLLESLAAGMTIPEIVRAYPTLTEQAVRGALEELAQSERTDRLVRILLV